MQHRTLDGFQSVSVRRALCILGVLLLLPSARQLAAQSPVVTTKGDPSVRDDSIYALVVDPAQHPEESIAMLLDDGIVRFEKDGTGVKTYRSVAQLLKQSAVDNWSEHTMSYDADREEFVLNWARVVDSNGKIISDTPLHVQEMDAEVPEGSPVYTHQKQVHVSLASVAAGRIVDISYSIKTKKPVMPGDYSANWRITTGGTIRRSRYILDLPADSKAQIHEFNMSKPPVETRSNGRIVRTWYVADQAYARPQSFASDTNSTMAHLSVSGEADWQAISKWYASLAHDRYAMTPALKQWLDSATAGAATPREKLMRVHRAVAQDVRYVSLSLGIGGFQPRLPAEVLRTASGDCKDKATTFVTLARGLGFEAFPVLVNSSARLDRKLPTTAAFDHEIAAVKIDGAWKYLDLTDEFGPFDEPVSVMNDDYGLMVRDDGKGELVYFPPSNPLDNRRVAKINGVIDTTGHFTGTVSVEELGSLAYELRTSFPDSLSVEQRKQVANAVARSLFDNATSDSIQVTRGRDLSVKPRMEVAVTAQPLRQLSDGAVLKLPLKATSVSQALSALDLEGTRTAWFRAESVYGLVDNTTELTLTLPAGWTAKMPQTVHATSAFGTYDAVYEAQGNQIHIVRHNRGMSGNLPPTAKTELVNWLKEVGKDDVEFLVLQHVGK